MRTSPNILAAEKTHDILISDCSEQHTFTRRTSARKNLT